VTSLTGSISHDVPSALSEVVTLGRTLARRAGQSGMDDLDRLDHFIQYAFAPQLSVQVRFSESKQRVGQRDPHQDACIGERAESGHGSTSVALAS
jgi:hypothetical protein